VVVVRACQAAANTLENRSISAVFASTQEGKRSSGASASRGLWPALRNIRPRPVSTAEAMSAWLPA